MNKSILIVYSLILLLIAYFSFLMLTDYLNPVTRNQMNFIIWIVDTIDLFIHEAGHFIFSPFGSIIGAMGGSLIQIIIPLVTMIVFLRTSMKSLPITLYWIAHNLVNVSVYMADAPYRQLKLISRYAIHDWHYLSNRLGIMDSIEDIAVFVQVIAGIIFICGFIMGIIIIVLDLRYKNKLTNKIQISENLLQNDSTRYNEEDDFLGK